MKMNGNMTGPLFDDMVEMVGEWKNDSEKWWEMVEHEMDMVDDMMDGKHEAINLASCLVTTIWYVL